MEKKLNELIEVAKTHGLQITRTTEGASISNHAKGKNWFCSHFELPAFLNGYLAAVVE